MVCMLLPFVCWFLVKRTSVQNIAFQKEEEEEEKKKKKADQQHVCPTTFQWKRHMNV